jgi:regulator of replication initiation timing
MRTQILTGILVALVIVLVYIQYKLNKSLSNQLQESKQELVALKQNIEDSVKNQNEITMRLDSVKKQSYEDNQRLKGRLSKLPIMNTVEQKQVLDAEYVTILECIEKTSLGEDKC